MGLRARAAVLAIVFASGCASFTARKHIGAAKKAEQAGDLTEAIREYDAAAVADPRNAEAAAGSMRAKTALAKRAEEEARQAEAAGNDEGALEGWKKAAKLDPKNAGYKAQVELTELRIKRAEPVELFLATKKLSEALPGDASVGAALAQAKDQAFRWYTRLADNYVEASAYEKAIEAFEKARQVDPENAVFKGTRYRVTKARQLESIGDAKLAAGDNMAAYRAFEEAQLLSQLPGLDAKMAKAKRSAGPMLEQLEQARTFEGLKKWEDAAEIYTALKDRKDAPADVAKAAANARLESAKIRAGRAAAYIEKGLPLKAQAELVLALEHTDAQPKVLELLRRGLDDVANKDPGAAQTKIAEAAGLQGDLPVMQPALKLVEASATVLYEEIKAGSETDPAGSMVRMQRLAPFAPKLAGYEATKKKLLKGAFSALLEQAEKLAGDGKDAEAAELLQTALAVSTPPQALKASLEAATTALRTGDYGTATTFFQRAEQTDGRSRLAQVGLRISRDRRTGALRKQAREAREVDDPVRASSAYKELLAIDPNDAEAKEGLAQLKDALIAESIRAAQAHQAGRRPGAAYVYFQRVLDLDPANEVANSGIVEVTGQLDVRKSALGWVAPVVRGDRLGGACAKAEGDFRDRLILYLTRTKGLGAEYLQREAIADIDGGKRPKPGLELRAAIEQCNVNAAGGSAAVSFQLRLANEVVAQESIVANFDQANVPKDELADGLDEPKVLAAVLKDAARLVAVALAKSAPKLADYRVVEAKARIKTGDEEGAARAYAALRLDKDKLSPTEKAALKDLELFILNRYR